MLGVINGLGSATSCQPLRPTWMKMFVALLSAFLQGALQAGDPSLSFVPKLLAVLAALWLSRGLVSERLLHFTSHVIAAIGQLGR